METLKNLRARYLFLYARGNIAAIRVIVVRSAQSFPRSLRFYLFSRFMIQDSLERPYHPSLLGFFFLVFFAVQLPMAAGILCALGIQDLVGGVRVVRTKP